MMRGLTYPSFHSIEDNGVIQIWSNDRIVFVGIRCDDEVNLFNTYNELSKTNVWLPNMLPPTKFGDSENSILAVECHNKLSLAQLDQQWYYENFLAYNKTSEQWSSLPVYLTINSKKLIWSTLRTVKAFILTKFRPKLEVETTFVSVDGEVIFTEYEPRDVKHDYSYETAQVKTFFEKIMSDRGQGCTIPNLEFQEMCNWVDTNQLGNNTLGANGTTEPLEKVLEQVVFWTPKMRITYICELWDKMDSNPIYPASQYAFHVNNSADWRTTMSGHPVLDVILNLGDGDYSKKLKASPSCPPSSFRTDNYTGFTAEKILKCGLTRLRDSYFHMITHMKMSKKYPFPENMDDTKLQSMFQCTFPSHMLEFGKARSVGLTFDVQDRVKLMLGYSRLDHIG